MTQSIVIARASLQRSERRKISVKQIRIMHDEYAGFLQSRRRKIETSAEESIHIRISRNSTDKYEKIHQIQEDKLGHIFQIHYGSHIQCKSFKLPLALS